MRTENQPCLGVEDFPVFVDEQNPAMEWLAQPIMDAFFGKSGYFNAKRIKTIIPDLRHRKVTYRLGPEHRQITAGAIHKDDVAKFLVNSRLTAATREDEKFREAINWATDYVSEVEQPNLPFEPEQPDMQSSTAEDYVNTLADNIIQLVGSLQRSVKVLNVENLSLRAENERLRDTAETNGEKRARITKQGNRYGALVSDMVGENSFRKVWTSFYEAYKQKTGKDALAAAGERPTETTGLQVVYEWDDLDTFDECMKAVISGNI